MIIQFTKKIKTTQKPIQAIQFNCVHVYVNASHWHGMAWHRHRITSLKTSVLHLYRILKYDSWAPQKQIVGRFHKYNFVYSLIFSRERGKRRRRNITCNCTLWCMNSEHSVAQVERLLLSMPLMKLHFPRIGSFFNECIAFFMFIWTESNGLHESTTEW